MQTGLRSNRWRVFLVSAGGEKILTDYESEEEAKQVVRSLRRELTKAEDRTIRDAREKYEEYMPDDKGNKPRSIDATSLRLRIFFPEEDLLIEDLRPSRCKDYYDALGTRPMPTTKRPLAVDSHRNVLAEAKSFWRWCVRKRWIGSPRLQKDDRFKRVRHPGHAGIGESCWDWQKIAGRPAKSSQPGGSSGSRLRMN